MGHVGATELSIVLVMALLLFGPKRLPQIARSLGRSIREFKSAVAGSDLDPSTDAALPKRATDTNAAANWETASAGSPTGSVTGTSAVRK